MNRDSRGISPMCMSGNIAENWKFWRSRFENYLIASEINKKSEAVQCAQVLHFIGEEGFKIYSTFKFEGNQKNKLKILLDKFEGHFLPQKNLTYERYKFFSYKQQPRQTLDQYVNELKIMAIKCKLGNLQEELTKTVLICGITNASIREKLLQEDDSLTLEKAIEKCKIIEMDEERSEVISVGQAHHGSSVYKGKMQLKGTTQKVSADQHEIHACTRCGKTHPINKCPAYYHVKKHFNKQRRKNNNVREVSENSKAPPKPNSQSGNMDVGSIVSISEREDVKLHKTKNARRPPRFIKVDFSTEDDKKTEELYKKVRGILNKLTPQKFETLLLQIKALHIDSTERLLGVIDLVFEKVMDEPNSSEVYALMCSELALIEVPTSTSCEERLEFVNFRKLLITRCQVEFEKQSIDESVRSKKVKEIDATTDPEKKKDLQFNLEEYDRWMRMKSVRNIRFIGELFKQNMLTVNIMQRCLKNLLENKDEESLECLCKLLTIVGKELESKHVNLNLTFDTMQNIVDEKEGKVSSSIRIMLQDVIDLRNSGWIPHQLESKAPPQTMFGAQTQPTITTPTQTPASVNIAEDESPSTSTTNSNPTQATIQHVPCVTNTPQHQPFQRRPKAIAIIDRDTGADSLNEKFEDNSHPTSGESSARQTPQPAPHSHNKEVQAAFAKQVLQAINTQIEHVHIDDLNHHEPPTDHIEQSTYPPPLQAVPSSSNTLERIVQSSNLKAQIDEQLDLKFDNWGKDSVDSNIKAPPHSLDLNTTDAALETLETEKCPLSSRPDNKKPYSSEGPSLERNDGRGSRSSDSSSSSS